MQQEHDQPDPGIQLLLSPPWLFELRREARQRLVASHGIGREERWRQALRAVDDALLAVEEVAPRLRSDLCRGHHGPAFGESPSRTAAPLHS